MHKTGIERRYRVTASARLVAVLSIVVLGGACSGTESTSGVDGVGDASPKSAISTPLASVPASSPTTPSTVEVLGMVRLTYGEYDEIYGGAACQGGGEGWLGDEDDLRLMSLQDEAPVIVTAKNGKKVGQGVLTDGTLTGSTCEASFQVTVSLDAPGPYTVTIGHRCRDCPYPSRIGHTYTVDQLMRPIVVPLKWK